MDVSRRNSLSLTWHMLLMGLMSLVLFFGGLLTDGGRQACLLTVRAPYEGVLYAAQLLPWETFSERQCFLLSRSKDVNAKTGSRLTHPDENKTDVTSARRPVAPPLPVRTERALSLHETAFLPSPGWSGPVSFALPPPLSS